MNYEPEGAMESIGDALGVVSRRIENDLHRFRDFIQEHTTETGSWRGEIHKDERGGMNRNNGSAL
jgi:hypothetical protein